MDFCCANSDFLRIGTSQVPIADRDLLSIGTYSLLAQVRIVSTKRVISNSQSDFAQGLQILQGLYPALRASSLVAKMRVHVLHR